MIDTNDKATQPLPLDEQPMKRKRGRPATGNAMTPAEKQRAYRERQRKLRDEMARELQNAEATIVVDQGFTESLYDELEDLKAQVKRWKERAEKAEAELASRDQKVKKGNVTEKEGRYVMQKKSPAGRWLKQCLFDSKREADKAMVGVPVEMVHLYRIKKA